MKKLFLPVLFNGNVINQGYGAKLFIPEMDAYFTIEQAEEKARQLALTDPSCKVVIFEAIRVIEPRKIEFATKKFNESGELVA